jgi:hypothetical protein
MPNTWPTRRSCIYVCVYVYTSDYDVHEVGVTVCGGVQQVLGLQI